MEWLVLDIMYKYNYDFIVLIREMEVVNWYPNLRVLMKVHGKMTCVMVLEDNCILTMMCTKEDGNSIRYARTIHSVWP